MMNISKYHYQTFVGLAKEKGYTIKYLAGICGLTEKTLSKQLRAVDGCDLATATCAMLREIVCPECTVDELFPENRRSRKTSKEVA